MTYIPCLLLENREQQLFLSPFSLSPFSFSLSLSLVLLVVLRGGSQWFSGWRPILGFDVFVEREREREKLGVCGE